MSPAKVYHDSGKLLGYRCPECGYELTGIDLHTARAEMAGYLVMEHGPPMPPPRRRKTYRRKIKLVG